MKKLEKNGGETKNIIVKALKEECPNITETVLYRSASAIITSLAHSHYVIVKSSHKKLNQEEKEKAKLVIAKLIQALIPMSSLVDQLYNSEVIIRDGFVICKED